eukprot:15205761-Alexandrium_andersonii.AAC.1
MARGDESTRSACARGRKQARDKQSPSDSGGSPLPPREGKRLLKARLQRFECLQRAARAPIRLNP